MEINSAIYLYLAIVTAAEASVSSISACLSMMDESLIFLIPVPQNTEPNVLGSQIINVRTSASLLPVKIHATRYVSCKFLTDGAVTSC